MKKNTLFFTTVFGMMLLLSAACGRFGTLEKQPEKPRVSNDSDENQEEVLQGTPLNEVALLHKLSMSLRGQAPTSEEYKQLKETLSKKTEQEFFSRKAKEYMNTATYRERMVLRLEELFNLKSSSSRPFLFPGAKEALPFSVTYKQFSATENVFRDIFTKNLSWDFLLNGKSYRLPVVKDVIYELDFYSNVLGLPSETREFFIFPDANDVFTPESYKEISFADDDPRIAGVLTSPRFFERYTNTGLNKNRRRAAAVFRIFLCDPMMAAIPENHDSKSLADLVFPEGEAKTETEIRTSIDSLHGSQPDCMACHYKLDPLGLGFRLSPQLLHDEASAGSLVFKKSNGENVTKSGRGIGDIAKHLSEQPEYASCQVEHFWNWFIGTDVPIGKRTRTELVKNFNNVGRRANDFIAYLVSRPEFRMRKSNDPQRAMVVETKNFLKRCDSCHDGVKRATGGQLPRFATWPIGDGSAEQAKDWLSKISKSLDLENQGKNRTMPTKEGFKPTLVELNNLKKWIEQGAPDERGQKMVSP